jgi:hypothetical protein
MDEAAVSLAEESNTANILSRFYFGEGIDENLREHLRGWNSRMGDCRPSLRLAPRLVG